MRAVKKLTDFISQENYDALKAYDPAQAQRLLDQLAPHIGGLVAAQPRAKAAPAPVQPVPRDQWPTWASAVAKLATGKDGGVGDTVDRCLRTVGIAQAVKRLLPSCGCTDRRASWNQLYPY